MIVVAIIGILAAVAIPQYQNYVARAQVSEGLSLASGLKTAVAEHYMTTGSYPAYGSEAAVGMAPNITGKYVETVYVASNEILVTFSDSAHTKIAGGEMVLYALDEGGSINWVCADYDYQKPDITKFLPSSCQE